MLENQKAAAYRRQGKKVIFALLDGMACELVAMAS
jgi:hypothetical protein